MKFKLLFLFFIFTSVGSFAQLSIDGTLIYLTEKTNECADLKSTYNNPLYYRMTDLRLAYNSGDPTKIIFEITKMYSTGSKEEEQYIFDPSQIKSFSYTTNSLDAVDFITLQMIGSTVVVTKKQDGAVRVSNASSFKVPYLKVDPLNQERMRKAFLHLRKLYEAKKGTDPFAN